GNIWVSNVDGNVFFVRRKPVERPALHVLEGIVVNDIFEDRENNLWLSTYGEGVWLIQSTRVRNVPIKGDIVSDLAIDPVTKHVLVATVNSGMREFSRNAGQFLSEVTNSRIKSKFDDNIFLGPLTDPGDGSLLLTGGYTVFRISDARIDSVVAPNPVTSIYYQKSRDRIWIGGRLFLAHSNTELRDLTVLPKGEYYVVRAIAEMPDGKIVLGTDKGLLIEGDHSTFVNTPADPSLLNADVNAVFYDPFRKTLWAATNNGLAQLTDGLLRLVNNPVTRVRCNAITQDESGNLYVGSVKGLIFFDGSSYEILTT